MLLSQIYPIFAKNRGQHASVLLSKLEENAKARTILVPKGGEQPEFDEKTLVDSPVLACFRDLYFENEAAANYVFFAPPSAGKTTAARAMLKWLLEQFDGDVKPRALMISGPVVQKAYFNHMTAALGADPGTAWFWSLCAALKADPSKPARLKSLLILDDFDTMGADNCNIEFMKAFGKTLYDKQDQDNSYEFFVVVMTQKEEVANELCRINNWKKIVPMPGAYEPPQAGLNLVPLPDPAWTGMPWTKAQLVDLLKGRFANPVFSQFSEERINEISDGDNPTLVIRKFRRLAEAQRREAAPGGTAAPDKAKFIPKPQQQES